MTKMLSGRINISRPYRSDGKRTIHIELIDGSSGIQIVEIEMSPEDFAEAITGRGHTPCLHDLTREGCELVARRVGKVVRTETAQVMFDCYKRNKKLVAEADRIEADLKERLGCDSVQRSDLFNPHRRVGPGVQSVTVWYYDEPTETEEA